MTPQLIKAQENLNKLMIFLDQNKLRFKEGEFMNIQVLGPALDDVAINANKGISALSLVDANKIADFVDSNNTPDNIGNLSYYIHPHSGFIVYW